jgi:TfoX/Sxy family transcriptional regulator of competence genes
MKDDNSDLYAVSLVLYDKLLATVPGVERKGDTVPYASHNGHMLTYLSKAGVMALRLPEPDRAAFIKKYSAQLCTQYGVVQKEYVEVPASLLNNTKELKSYLQKSFAYVSAMKPKPKAKKKAAKKR